MPIKTACIREDAGHALPLTDSDLSTHRILRWPEVHRLTGTCRTVAYTSSDFPRRVRIGPRSVGWLAGEVLAFIKARANERDDRKGCAMPPALTKAVHQRKAAKDARPSRPASDRAAVNTGAAHQP